MLLTNALPPPQRAKVRSSSVRIDPKVMPSKQSTNQGRKAQVLAQFDKIVTQRNDFIMS